MQYSRRLWQVASAQWECSDAPSCEISKASSISAARYECQECLKVLIPLFTLQTKTSEFLRVGLRHPWVITMCSRGSKQLHQSVLTSTRKPCST